MVRSHKTETGIKSGVFGLPGFCMNTLAMVGDYLYIYILLNMYIYIYTRVFFFSCKDKCLNGFSLGASTPHTFCISVLLVRALSQGNLLKSGRGGWSPPDGHHAGTGSSKTCRATPVVQTTQPVEGCGNEDLSISRREPPLEDP